MESSYNDKDIIFVQYTAYKKKLPRRYDVICATVYDDETTNCIEVVKRIIGMPGETVLVQDGEIYIDEKIVDDYFRKPKAIPLKMFAPVKLDANEYFIIGDNRDISMYYIIRRNQILGKVLF